MESYTKEEINQTITNSVNLDKIQKAINDGCGVNMTMPSANNNKLSLPIWTGTATQYATITPVAGMNYDGGNRRDVNGKANAGLTLGIIGTALGAWALFGNRRSAGASILGGAGGRMLGDGSTNINVLGATAGSGSSAPTAFQVWEKSCE